MSSTPPNTPTLHRQAFLQQVLTGATATNAQYAALLKPNITTHPLPYWGDPPAARIATFGVNPSAMEFTGNRQWPTNMTVAQLDTRAVMYFRNPNVPPHRWFEGYDDPRNGNKALNILGYSYRVDAVHLDLSPRATRAMGTADRKHFIQMVAADMQWFLVALTFCRNLKGAIMSGSVTGVHYFDEFLSKYLPSGYTLKLHSPFGTGRGATALYTLSGPGFSFPVLFCGTSPSGDKGVRFANEVSRLLSQLRAAGF
jgi:hypothetical protein